MKVFFAHVGSKILQNYTIKPKKCPKRILRRRSYWKASQSLFGAETAQWAKTAPNEMK